LLDEILQKKKTLKGFKFMKFYL